MEVDTNPIAASTLGRFQCPECQRTFGRIEHLTRHARSHAKSRVLKCSQCRKGFYRADALKRHELVHKEPRRSILGHGSRACLSCATGRRKCSGGVPCSGCYKRSIECLYPGNGRPEVLHLLNDTDSSMSLPSQEMNLPQAGTQYAGVDNEDLPLKWSIRSGSPVLPDQNQRDDRDEPPNISDRHTQSRQISSFNSGDYSTAYLPDQLLDAMPSTSIDVIPEQREGPVSSQDATISRNTHLDSLNSNDRRDLRQNQMSFRLADTWFDNNFSSINWLPDDWTPGFNLSGAGQLDPLDNQNMVNDPNIHANITTYSYELSEINQLPPSQIQRHIESSQLISQVVDSPRISSPSQQSAHSAGHYYVDGDGARLPRVRKPPYHNSEQNVQMVQPTDNRTWTRFTFPLIDESQNSAPTDNGNIIAFPTAYEKIKQIFSLTCITSTHYLNFETSTVPSPELLGRFLKLYIDNFQTTLPFIHPATFDVSTTHWLLLLSMAAVGSHYYHNNNLLIIALHEFLRRAIETVMEREVESRPDSLTMIQAKMLNSVGMMYCGDDRLINLAKACHSDLAHFCLDSWRVAFDESGTAETDADNIALCWKSWCKEESNRRTTYCIWLLDCMWAFHFQTRPILSLQDANTPVPCQEVLWEATSALDWHQLHFCATSSLTLHEAIQIAYIEKRLQSSMGEFSRILCIHALFRRTWECEQYFSQPLSMWNPTAAKQDISTISNSIPVWLPGIPPYSKWRNSACDVLDILHWHANSVIGAASGMEHPTVLHLHLARVILLTPFREITKLANLMRISSPSQYQQRALQEARIQVQRWALEDQHKARLAMIHAGVLFWHVRRYSTDAFYEPSSVFLATLALWAYGTFAAPTSGTCHNGESPQTEKDDADSPFPTSMQLDRPADDELVQLFVKRGAGMRANITGVGNLCSAKGPARALIEGRNLLAGLKGWGESKRAIGTLSMLVEVCQAQSSV